MNSPHHYLDGFMPKYFKIIDNSISCSSCTQTIEGAIAPIRDEKRFKYETNHEEKSLFLTIYDEQAVELIQAQIIKATREAGFFEEGCFWIKTDEFGRPLSTLKTDRSALPLSEFLLEQKLLPSPSDKIVDTDNLYLTAKKKKITQHLLKGLPSICLGILWMALPLLPMMTPLFLTMITFVLAAISSLAIIYSGWEIFARAYSAAKHKRINMNTQFAVSVIVAFIISWLTFTITGLSFLFDAALLILGFRHVGLAIEEWAKQKIDKGNSLLDGLPKEVEMVTEGVGEQKLKAAQQLMPGDKIRIKCGMILPVDGECMNEGSFTAVDLSGQAGDTFGVEKKGKVLQGYKVMSDFVDIEVKKTMDDSTLACIQEKVKKAAAKRTKTNSYMDYIGANFSKAVFIITFLSFAFVSVYAFFYVGISLTIALILAFQTALGVLVAACPCTFGSIVPLMDKEATYKCLENGALVLNPNVLNILLKAKYLLFDLNGTCTTGEKKVHNFKLLNEKLPPMLPAEKIRAYLKFLEEKSDHLTGEAIYKYLTNFHSRETLDEKEASELKAINYGKGLGIKISGSELWVGNQDLLREKIKLKAEEALKTLPAVPSMTQRNYIGYGDQIIGYIDIIEPIRLEALSVLNYFRNEGFKVALCTGADPETAKAYGLEHLKFEPKDIKAGCSIKPIENDKRNIEDNLLSEEKESKKQKIIHPKTAYINQLKKSAPVIFVGDAGNDTHPIAEADVGVAVDSPTKSEACKIGANVYIGQRSLWPLVKMHMIAKQSMRARNLSLGVSILYNLFTFAFMGGLSLLWLGFMMHPGLGVAMMVAQALIVLMFAAIFRIWPLPNAALISKNKNDQSTDLINALRFPQSYNFSPISCDLTQELKETPVLISDATGSPTAYIESSSPLAQSDHDKVRQSPGVVRQSSPTVVIESIPTPLTVY